MRKLRNILENRIWILAAVMLTALLVLSNGSELFQSSMALEQNARCGLTEHVHGEECYYRDILICKEKAHFHNERCYLVLLEENDINSLLIKVDAMPGNSLERLIAQVLDRAIWYGWYGDENLNYITSGGSFASSAAASSAAQLWNQYAASSASSGAASSSASSSSSGGLWGLFGGSSSSGAGSAATDSSASNSWNFFGSSSGSSSSSGFWSFFGSSASSSSGWSFFGASSSAGAASSSWTFFATASSSQDGTGAASSGELSLFAASENGGVVEADITKLNANVVRGNIVPNVVLNEGLTTMALVPQDTQVIAVAAPEASGGVSTLAIGDDLVDNDSAVVNFYIYLDKSKFMCIGNLPVTDYSKYDYIAKSAIAALFNTGEVVSGITAGGLETGYSADDGIQIRYMESKPNENGPSSIFSKNANQFSYHNSDIVEFKDVIDYSGDCYPRYATLMMGVYDDNYNATYTPINFYTVTLQDPSGNPLQTWYVQEDRSITIPINDSYTKWQSGTTTYDSGDSVKITGKTVIKAVSPSVNVTCLKTDGTVLSSQTITDGKYDLETLDAGYIWIDTETKTGYPGGATVTITKDTVFQKVAGHKVTFDYPDGTADVVQYVKSGSEVIMPDGYAWTDGTRGYSSGEKVTITEDTVFRTAASLKVSYDVNFPTSGTDFSNDIYWSTAEKPTIAGTTSATYEQTVAEGGTATIRNVSQREVIVDTAHGTTTSGQFNYPVYLQYWTVKDANDVKIYPGVNLTYEELSAYDTDNNGEVELVGVWDYGRVHTVNFCIAYNNVNLSGTRTDYTPALFTTYMGGENINTSYSLTYVAGQDATVNYQNDQAVRALYGSDNKGMWLASFPDDNDMFKLLENYVGTLKVDNEIVDAKDLNASAYTIRWSHFFYSKDDGWHVDGRLVKKRGNIQITKTFGGEDEFIAAGKNGFNIVAKNGTKNTDGSFTPFTGTAARSVTLGLTDSSVTVSGNTYTWIIEDVNLGEYWQVTENLPSVDADGDKKADYACYAEYTVIDSDGITSQISQYGTTAGVVGKTYALDQDPTQGLKIEFKNYYYPSDAILIKKEDADTGLPIGGASFALLQGGSQLKFEQKDMQYIQNPGGDLSEIETAEDGFSNISASGINFTDSSPLVVRETNAPSGYALTPAISVGKNGIVNIEGIAKADWDKYAEYNENTDVGGSGVLVVKDHSYATSLTAEKVWLCAESERAESVVFVLQANGENATNIFPDIANASVVVTGDTDWKYTWNKLPAYANGKLVTWSVKEIQIGTEIPMTGAEGFANWIVAYSTPVSVDEDLDGTPDRWSVAVSNTVRRPLLVVHKTDSGGTTALVGAEFTLQRVEETSSGVWEAVSGAVLYTKVTGGDGQVIFDNLSHNAYYRLTETAAPAGYLGLADAVILKVDNAGIVSFAKKDTQVEQISPYNIAVRNINIQPLPETGGTGTALYQWSGLLLMAAAVLLFIDKRPRRKEGTPS